MPGERPPAYFPKTVVRVDKMHKSQVRLNCTCLASAGRGRHMGKPRELGSDTQVHIAVWRQTPTPPALFMA
jgi:hypothetical protein